MKKHDAEYNEYGSGKKTLRAYVIGFVLSILLTFSAFGLVENKLLSDKDLYISLASLAILQLLAQTLCFLRLNTSKPGRWNLLPFIFVILIISILVSGTFWIMWNLNYNMMN